LFDLEQLGTASGTDIGLVRSVNQDAFGEFDDLKRGTHLLFVADGMGGHRAGEVASQLAVECVGETFDANDLPAEEFLQLALERANARIFDASIAEEQFAGMGTTGVALLLTGERTGWIAHVGDSRAYRWREGEFSLLTSDHSVVGELVRRGQLTPEQARIHPQSNEILRALGTQPDVDVELTEVDIEIGDRFLLCSDGLSGMLADEEIGELLGREQPEQAVRTLIRMANDAGGTDNITIQIAEIPTKALGSSDPSGQHGVAGDAAKVERESGGASNDSTSAQPTTGGGIAAAGTAFRWTVVLMLFAALLLLIFAGSEPSG
jgi:protein phosphatase